MISFLSKRSIFNGKTCVCEKGHLPEHVPAQKNTSLYTQYSSHRGHGPVYFTQPAEVKKVFEAVKSDMAGKRSRGSWSYTTIGQM